MKYPTINLAPDSGQPLVEQLHRQLTWLIASGQWQPGENLPPIRHLAAQLSIHMHTVRSAYRRLEKDGLVTTRQGSGTRLLPFEPRRLLELAGRSRSGTIGIILPGLVNPFYHEVLQGLEQIADGANQMLLVCDAHDEPQRFVRAFAQLAAKQVDGILVASFDLNPFLGANGGKPLPLVTVDWPGVAGPAVNFDLEQAAFQATRHLLEHGHGRIGLLTLEEALPNLAPRQAGYTRALKETGIAFESELVARLPGFLPPHGELGARRLLDLPKPPTAILAVADTLALGAMQALRQAGKRIPDEMALASMDDTWLAGLVDPALTSAHLPARAMGQTAARLLLDLIEGREPPQRQVSLPASLVVRKSCGCV